MIESEILYSSVGSISLGAGRCGSTQTLQSLFTLLHLAAGSDSFELRRISAIGHVRVELFKSESPIWKIGGGS
jgi:hypothetical protein